MQFASVATTELTNNNVLFVVPPNIDDNSSSSDTTVSEGANVTMNCRATGSPEPHVKWKRDDNSKIKLNNGTYGKWIFLTRWPKRKIKFSTVNEVEGEVLEMVKVNRLEMGGYLCIATNSIPPSVSKLIKLSVECKWFRQKQQTISHEYTSSIHLQLFFLLISTKRFPLFNMFTITWLCVDYVPPV